MKYIDIPTNYCRCKMNWLLWILELTAVFLFTNARRLRSYQRHNDIDYGDPGEICSDTNLGGSGYISLQKLDPIPSKSYTPSPPKVRPHPLQKFVKIFLLMK